MKLAVTLAFTLLSVAAQATESQISLHGFLVNTREIRQTEILVPAQNGDVSFWGAVSFPLSTLSESDSLCHALGYGCLVVNYTDDPKKIRLSEGKDSVRPREISLRGLARGGQPAQRSRYAGYADFADAAHADEQGFADWMKRLDGQIELETAQEFLSYLTLHPRMAARLTREFSKSLEADRGRGARSDRSIILERAIVLMAELTAEMFSKVADSGSPTYPYVNDHLVLPNSLLDLDSLYTRLSALKAWPRIRHLQASERAGIEPGMAETEGGKFVSTGAYLPESGAIALDLTEPFFDVVYALYHELWHVAVFHSKRTVDAATGVRALLATPESTESDTLIRNTLLRLYAEHELLAIDQSSRLFRATGQLARQWGDAPESAQGWHDSYFGTSKDLNLFIPIDLRKIVQTDVGPDPISLFFLVPAFVELPLRQARARHHAESIMDGLAEKNASLASLDAFLQTRTPEHLARYRQRYLSDIETFDFNSVRAEFMQRAADPVVPQPLHLTCTELARLLTVLGPQADYGLPFPFDVEGGWDKCAKASVTFQNRPAGFKPRSSLPYLRPVSSGRNPASKSDPQVSLRAFPVNSREIQSDIYPNDPNHLWTSKAECQGGGCMLFWPIVNGPLLFPASTLKESDPVCKSIGAGCIVINYAENPGEVWLTADHRLPTATLPNRVLSREISFQGVIYALNFQSMALDPRMVRYKTFQEAEKGDLPDFELKLRALDGAPNEDAIHDFTTFVATHPRVAGRLTTELRTSAKKDAPRGFVSDRSKTLERAIIENALLMLEAFTKAADSTSPFYPYMGDRLVEQGSLLDLDRIYTSLSAIGRWPTIRALTRGDRETLDPAFLETDASGRYSATGVYLPDTNSVLVDLSEPFYDVVYTLYHELWHVAVYHSKRTSEIGSEVQALLRAPESEESNQLIRHTLLRFFAEHELLAIDQSSRLYRATGQLARQWGEPALSAQGWHDSYFGSSQDMNLFISRDIRKQPTSRVIPILGYYIPLTSGTKQWDTTNRALEEKQSLAASFPRFLESRTPFHLAHYRKRYLNDVESFDFDSLRLEFAQRNQVSVVPATLHLSCGEVERLATALGDQAAYGIPFPFDVEGGWDRCQKPAQAFLGKSGAFSPRCSLPNLRFSEVSK